MTDFPTDLSTQRPSGDMKDDLDDFLDTCKEMLSGGFEQKTPAAGTLTVDKGICYVQGSGATSISTIAAGQLQTGRAIIFVGPDADNSALDLTFVHGTNLQLRGGVNLVITSSHGGIILRLAQNGLTWVEVTRFETANASLRTFLDLGTAAYEDEGPGNGLDADTLDGVQGAGYLLVAAKAADSELLDGKDSTDFADLTSASEQSFTGALKTIAGLMTIQHASSKPLLKMFFAGDERVNLGMQAAEHLEMVLFDNALNRRGTLRISETNGDIYYTNDDEPLPERIMTPGKIDALTLATAVADRYHPLAKEVAFSGDTVQSFSAAPGTLMTGWEFTVPRASRYRISGKIYANITGSGSNTYGFLIATGAVGFEVAILTMPALVAGSGPMTWEVDFSHTYSASQRVSVLAYSTSGTNTQTVRGAAEHEHCYVYDSDTGVASEVMAATTRSHLFFQEL